MMDYDTILAQVLALLQQEKRLSYRVLKLRLQLDDDALEALKEDLIYAKHLAIDEDGKVLVWVGGAAPQADQTRLASTAPPASRAREAERRQLTVMFCDLAESTTLSGQLDPEDLREVIRAYQQTSAEVIHHFEGYIAQYLGDGLLVYFSYPHAHEDDAQRAVRAGLGILNAIATLNHRLAPRYGRRVAVRIGIHAGLVVVGEMGDGGRHERLALGETPNLAARLQSLAAPDTVAISATTHRLVQGYVRCDDLGSHRLKGVETPMQVYRVMGASAAQSRLDVVGAAGLTPLVGGEPEVGLLRERWAQSQDGLGQVVLLSGEAGIGKSRLVRVLTERVVEEGATRLTLRCSPYHTHSAFYPVIEHLQRRLRWHRNASPQARLAALEQALQTARLSLAEVVPLVAALLSLPVPAHYPPLTLSPQRQKQQTQEVLVAWLLAETALQPVLAVWEDLHWADPSTLELLGLLLDQAPTARLLMVLTCRPEFQPPWAPRSNVTPLPLTRLLRPQVEEMIVRVTGGKPLPADVVQQIVAKTDGIPLFVEELMKTILESGLVREEAGRYMLTGPLPPLAIPATLQDALMARLDRLAPVKEVAQLGAVLGREFAYELLQGVAPLDEVTLQQALARLVDAELLYQQGLPPQATYVFKHALIQDTAYQSLLKSTRQQYHQQIAQVLEARFPEITETQPELLAHHYTEAGLIAQAVPYWQRAGQGAIERSANVEAIAYLTKGLALLETLPDTPARRQQELTLRVTLGAPLMMTKGYAAPDVERACARALELCRQLGETPRLFPVLAGLRGFYLARAELHTARELGEQLLRLAQPVQHPALLLQAYYALGETLFYLGELVAARTHLEQGSRFYEPQKHRSRSLRAVQHPGVACRADVASVLWLLGYPDQALQRSREALILAQELAHPISMAFASYFAAVIHQYRREWQLAQAQAEAAMTRSREQGFPFWVASSQVLRGWALIRQGREAEGITQLCTGLAAHRATGAELLRPYHLSLLTEGYGQLGQAVEGLSVLAEALALVHRPGDSYWEVELHRLTGELLLVQAISNEGQAETCFQQALDVARRQNAKSLELRAAMSLSRLWQQQSKRAEAYDMLAPIYNWFTEGFDTADLQEAKALLEELLH